LKVFIETNVIIDVAVRADRFPESVALISKLMDSSDHSLWISAISLNNIQFIVSKLADKPKVRKLLEMIRTDFSIIPFRKSVFTKTLDHSNPDFEDAIQMYSAQEMNMDCIVTRNPEGFINSAVKVYTPSRFLEKWNNGEFDNTRQVPFLDLKAQHHQIYNEIDDRFADIMANTGFILGKYVDEFEKGFAALHDAKYCIGVSSGTDALHVAMLSLGIGHGDLVVVPVNTFIATAEPVSLCGATPVFVDCDAYFNMDAEKLESLILGMNETDRKRLKAVVPVHLYGQAADMTQILRIAEQHGLDVIEDACQAHLGEYNGKKIGTMGKFGAFSFYPGKNLGAWGEAGALITNDESLFLIAKQIRQHGEIERYHHNFIGQNYRMSAFQGAALSVKLKYIAEWTEKRQKNAGLYRKYLDKVAGIELPRERAGCASVFHLFVIQTEERDGLQKYLQENGIASGLHYPVPLHFQEAYKSLGYKKGDFPVAERAAQRILSLPMYPELTENNIAYVCEKISDFLS
jgi:dTDP-4-amino-4,6-dideoxygalactose transaminase